MKIIAFDPSMSTGVAIGTIRNKKLYIEKVGLIFGDHSLEQGFVFLDYEVKISKLLLLENPNFVVQEGYFVSRGFVQGVDVNFGLRTVISMACARENKPLFVASPSEWKKFVAKRSTPTKEDKKKFKNKAKKMFIQEALKEKGITLPDKYIGEKGRKMQVPSDVWDAIGILLYGAYIVDCVTETEDVNFNDIVLFY